MTTPEQQAREMLGRMKVEHADYYSAGDLIELANLIAKCDALKAELAAIKCAGEPVAWVVTSEKQDGTRHTYALMGREKDVRDACDFGEPIPLYPRPCVPLTNEQVWSIAGPHITHYQFGEATHRDINCLAFARAIEAAHNIKGAEG